MSSDRALFEIKTLGEIAFHKMGGTPSTANESYWETGDLLWATPGDLGKGEVIRIHDTARKITAAGLAVRNAALFPTGTVLLSTTATIGNIGLATCPIYCNQQITAIVPNEKVESEYLAYWFLRSKAELMRLGGTSTATHINQKNLATLRVPVPPLPEQRRIVDLLSRAEGIVRLRREAEKKAAELIPALFLNLFGDPATNPKGWPVDKLDAVAKIISGATKGRRFDPSEAIELPYMRVANVKDGHLDLAEIKTIAVKRGEVEKYRLQPGDLLMTEGGDPDKLGRGALWSGEIETCLHQNHIFKVRADRSRLLPEYLCELVGSRYGKAYFLRVAKKTTGIATINRTQLGGFPVVVPPLDRQAEFVEKFAAVRSIQSQQSAATAKAQAAFDALLARCFSPDSVNAAGGVA
jgi:type I restriction enzyme S subunit